jgi:hypothetical protein
VPNQFKQTGELGEPLGRHGRITREVSTKT